MPSLVLVCKHVYGVTPLGVDIGAASCLQYLCLWMNVTCTIYEVNNFNVNDQLGQLICLSVSDEYQIENSMYVETVFNNHFCGW